MSRVLLLAALLLASATASSAQSSGDQPTFRSGVELVRFDVRVVDEAGRPVTDLKPEDVEIYEDGKRLPVLLFQRVTEPAGNYFEEAIRATTAEVSSNAAFPRGHLYILIFDQQHITPGNEQRARMAAEDFIRRRVRPSDRVALFALPGPGPQIGFTADKMRAIEQLSAIRGAYRRSVDTVFGSLGLYEARRIVQGDERQIATTTSRLAFEGGGDILGASVSGRAGAPEDPATVRRILIENARTVVNNSDSETRQFLQRLADVIRGFRDIEGRKTVILFSEGFFSDNLTRELEEVAAAAAQSYCVFHAFDLNQRGPSIGEANPGDTDAGSEIQARISPLATLAVETDGVMLVDAANRIPAALDRIAAQAQDYYLVGFTPSPEALANRGKYRRVTVKLRRDATRISARTGYAVAPVTVVADRRRSIDAVLGAPFVQQGLRLDYTTYITKGGEAGKQRVVLSLATDLPVRSGSTDMADVVFVVRDTRDGQVVASGTDTIPLPSRAQPGRALGTAAWRIQFSVAPGTYLMRTVVREPGGLVGSGDRRLDVRPLEGPDITASDLVLGSAIGGLPVVARAYNADGLTAAIEAYGRTSVQMQGLEVRLELRRPGEDAAITSAVAELLEPQEGESGISRRASAFLPIENVPPGDYVAHAIVRARGEVAAERTRQVEVLSGNAPPADETLGRSETWAPLDVVRGDLARRYLQWLTQQARDASESAAARFASADRWEEVELEIRRVKITGVTSHALGGLALFVREDYAAAAEALSRAATAAPDHALTAFFLGWAHEGAGDKRAALSAWRSAAHLDPSLVSAHLALADGYLRLAQPQLAIQAIRAGLVALPGAPELVAKLYQLEGMRQ